MLSEKVGYLVAFLQRYTAGLLILASLFCVPVVNGSKGERNVEEITGAVVAYKGIDPCIANTEICSASLIVRIDVASEAKPSYIRVDLTFPSYRRLPMELIKSKKRWRLKLIRTPSLDEKIDEFILGKSALGKEFKIPKWVLIAGAEDEKLPFGEVLHSYSLVKNGFKLIPN